MWMAKPYLIKDCCKGSPVFKLHGRGASITINSKITLSRICSPFHLPHPNIHTHVKANSPCNLPWNHRGGVEVLWYSFFNLSTWCGWVVHATPQPFYHQETDTIYIMEEAGWAPGPLWTGAENLTSTRIRSADCAACSDLVYWLTLSGPPTFPHSNCSFCCLQHNWCVSFTHIHHTEDINFYGFMRFVFIMALTVKFAVFWGIMHAVW
jgi:hypothetical protein